MSEVWDAYDENFQKIENVTLVRGEKIPEGMFHLVGEIIVKHQDGTYLLMQRDLRKRFGGKWELTAGGSALQGEDALQCAKRELCEETGIIAASVTEIGRVIDRVHHTLYIVFLCDTAWEKGAVQLQEGETIAYKWADKDTVFQMELNELASIRTMDALKQKGFQFTT